MSLNAKNSKNKPVSTIEPMEAGTYPARLVIVADLGLQPQRPFQGQDKPPAYEILTTYEFLDEFLPGEDGEPDVSKPRWVSENFPLFSIDSERARSTKRYISLDPNMQFGGDWSKLIGTPCLVTIVKNVGKGSNSGKIFNNIVNVAAMRPKDALRAPPLVNSAVVFDMDDNDVGSFKSLPEWIQKKIVGSLEFKGSQIANALDGIQYTHSEPQEEDDGADELDDEVPF